MWSKLLDRSYIQKTGFVETSEDHYLIGVTEVFLEKKMDET